jgi:hypothetical protein
MDPPWGPYALTCPHVQDFLLVAAFLRTDRTSSAAPIAIAVLRQHGRGRRIRTGGVGRGTSVDLEGNTIEPTIRVTTTRPSSNGWRTPSTALRRKIRELVEEQDVGCASVRECR